MAEGWNHLTRKATTAITRFTSGDGKEKYLDEEHKQLAIRNAGWGLMVAEVLDDDRVVGCLEAPGMNNKEFDLQVIDEVLIVKGEKNSEGAHRGSLPC